MLCLVLCLPDSYGLQVLFCIRSLAARAIITTTTYVRTYVLHTLGKRNIEARKDSNMDKLHSCSFTRNVIARE